MSKNAAIRLKSLPANGLASATASVSLMHQLLRCTQRMPEYFAFHLIQLAFSHHLPIQTTKWNNNFNHFLLGCARNETTIPKCGAFYHGKRAKKNRCTQQKKQRFLFLTFYNIFDSLRFLFAIVFEMLHITVVCWCGGGRRCQHQM